MKNNHILFIDIPDDSPPHHTEHLSRSTTLMTGTVFAAALNHHSQLIAWRETFEHPPYQSPPKTPVWFVKPRNTITEHQQAIVYPDDINMLCSGATLGIVIGKITRKVSVEQASQHIAGHLLANEISLPETSFYRPAIKEKCRDNFCPLSSFVSSKTSFENLTISTEINGQLKQTWNTRDLVRTAPELLSALSDFVTLQPGDIILLGTPHERISLNPGDIVTVKAPGFSTLENRIIANEVPL